MYEVWIIAFCFIRSIITRYFFKKKTPTTQQAEQSTALKGQPSFQSQSQQNTSPERAHLNEMRAKKQQIESTIEQYNNPSTFVKYSKMQRQLTKINNQIQSLEKEISNKLKQQLSSQPKERGSLLEQRKKKVNHLHKELGNKDMLIKALINLGLIVGCSYFQSSQMSLCAGYPAYAFCNESGKINGGWVFIISSIVFSY